MPGPSRRTSASSAPELSRATATTWARVRARSTAPDPPAGPVERRCTPSVRRAVRPVPSPRRRRHRTEAGPRDPETGRCTRSPTPARETASAHTGVRLPRPGQRLRYRSVMAVRPGVSPDDSADDGPGRFRVLFQPRPDMCADGIPDAGAHRAVAQPAACGSFELEAVQLHGYAPSICWSAGSPCHLSSSLHASSVSYSCSVQMVLPSVV
jgi:hypothetical protein